MFSIVTKKSSSGKTTWNNFIYNEPTSKSLASLVLLNDYYHAIDYDYQATLEFRMKRVEFSRTTLKRWQKQIGSLFCVYCDKPDLIIELEGMSVPNEYKATLDHIVPVSEGGEVFDINNVICSCGTCNKRKDSKSLDEFLKNIKLSKVEYNNRVEEYRN